MSRILVLVLWLVFAGCGLVQGERDEAPATGRDANVMASAVRVATPSPSPLPTPTPSPTPSPTPTPSLTPVPPLSLSELERALLARGDLPAGWSTYDEDPFPPPCGQTPALEAEAERLAQENFGEGDFGPFVRQMVAAYRRGDAVAAMERTRRQFLECGEWAGSFNGQRFTFRVSEAEFTAAGEQSFALRLQADGPIFLKAESLLVFVRRGDAAFLVAYTAAGFGGASVDGELTEQLVRRADERLRQVLGRR